MKAQRRVEDGIQTAFIDAVRRHAGPLVIVFSVPNEGKRSKAYGAKLKRMGLLPGVGDTVAMWSGGGMFIEFKAPGESQSKAQKAFQASAGVAGVPYIVCEAWDVAYEALDDYGAPLANVLRDGRMVRRHKMLAGERN